MSERDPRGGEAARRYREALARHGLQDVQPLYRRLLVRLKSADAGAYEAAVFRYEREVLPGVAEGEGDPLTPWLEYGIWLAGRLQPGQAMAVDGTGRARPVTGEPPLGPLLLHLPEERRVPAIPLAIPEEPSDPQRATLELLCGPPSA